MIVSTSSPQDSMKQVDEHNREKWIAAILKSDKDKMFKREELSVFL